MSGSIGADRIPRSAVQNTVENYIKHVLSGFDGYRSAKITGSYNTGLKKDHGDIDLCVYVEAGDRDLRQVKKDLVNYLSTSEFLIPFKAGHHKGEKVQMYGNVVTCQVPIDGFEGLAVQMDNMVVLSEKEQEYQKNFLDADAAKQGLEMGLVRVILQEENPEQVFKRMGIKKLPELDKNQEFEFVLSASGLSLRKVTLEDFKEVDREEIWRSTDWQDVVKLLKGYDLSKDFDHLLADVKEKVQNPRSRRRIVGIMKSMINIGRGEEGTPKGDAKLRAIQAAKTSLGTLDEIAEEDKKGVIGLYGGGFKPPHKGHYSIVQKLLGKTDKVIILIGSGNREGIPINQDQSKRIWEIYIDASGWSDRVEVREVKSPVGEIYNIIKNPDLQDYQFRIAKMGDDPEEDKKWAYYLKNQDKFPNVKLITIPALIDHDSDKLSASSLRASEEKIKKGNWIPQGVLSTEDVSKVIEIALEQIQVEVLKEFANQKGYKVMNLENIVEQSLRDAEFGHVAQKSQVSEGFYGMTSDPGAAISSANREKLGKVYEWLKAELANQGLNIIFNHNNIIIKILYPGDVEGVGNQAPGNLYEGEDDVREDTEDFNYIPYFAEYLKFLKEEKKLNIEPLPEIILDKSKQDLDVQAKTGDYSPSDKVLRVYTKDRHPKDILRSFSHEMIHHIQCLEGKDLNQGTTNLGESKDLDEIEAEAYVKGNMYFREWTEKLQRENHPAFLG